MQKMALVFLAISTILLGITKSTSSSKPTFLYTYCSNTTFANHSQYLSSNATTSTGFHATSAGNNIKSAVYGLFMCRGDQNATSCKACVDTATTTDLPKRCRNKEVGYARYDECIVRYSNESFLGKMEDVPLRGLMNTQNITGNLSHFKETMVHMLNSTAIKAEKGGPKQKYAVDIVSYTSLQTIFGMTQCTPDLSPRDCFRCLSVAIKVIPVSVGAQVLQPSCMARYENYPFWNGALDLSFPTPPPHLPTNYSTPAVLSPPSGENSSTFESLQYDFAVVQSATNYFSDENKLGEGGFGAVYKGELSNGQIIAVKRLSKNSGQGIQEFKNEVMLVAELQHRNLVRLLGFCVAEEEKLLVYEYVPNKSLNYFLFDKENQGKLSWTMRYNILQGIARGMVYLHQDSRLRIIHRDLKTSNILLDSDMNPKISDFGMARIFCMDEIQENTSTVVGTYGYMAPEYAMRGQFSIKSDVYSFGVLALEIISGKKNSTFHDQSSDDDLLSYTWKKWKDNVALEFVDPTIRDLCSTQEAIKCVHLGLLCVQESIDQRPTMANIVLAFDANSVNLPLPDEPTFLMKSMISESKFAKRFGMNQSASGTSTPWSVNEVSITELDPR